MPTAQDYLGYIQQFLPLVLLILLFYFLMIRPQKKRDQAEKQMRNSLQPGDQISTIGGIIGTIVSIKDDDTLIIQSSSDRSKLKVYRWAIRGKLADPSEAEAPKSVEGGQ